MLQYYVTTNFLTNDLPQLFSDDTSRLDEALRPDGYVSDEREKGPDCERDKQQAFGLLPVAGRTSCFV